MNDSSTGGYLAPTSAAPAEDDALDDILQAVVVSITGLAGSMVRPRWQPTPPKEPEPTADWCAIGVLNETPDENVSTVHHPDGSGHDETQLQVELEILASFYGPHARANTSLLRDGLMVAQNREALFGSAMALVGIPGRIIQAPELINQSWRRRADLPFRIRRQITRTWPVLNILEAVGTIHSEQGDVAFDTANARK